MILKKDAPSYVIWALFAAFNVLLIAVFGLYSGLFPTSDTTETMLFTGLFTVLVGGVCFVVSFLIDKLSVYFMQDKRFNSNLIYWILFILVLIGGIGLRSYILYNEGFVIRSGNLLFDTATVTNGGIIKAESIWKLFYLIGMRTVLYVTGDVAIAALIYQMVIRILFFILIGVCARIMIGRVSSIIVLSLLMFLPPFITVHNLDAASFFELFVALELIFLALYFRRMTKAKALSAGSCFWFVLLGIGIGALLYMDAGTILFWNPMILLLFVFRKIKDVILSLMCVLPGAVIGFMLILICWDGFDVMVPALNRWASRYFASGFSIESFEVIGESGSSVYAVLYLVLAIVMLCGTFAFLFHKKTTRLSPVMLQALLVCLVAPLMGETGVNTLRMMTLMCILVIGGGIACMLTSYDTSDFDVLFGPATDEPATDASAKDDDWAKLEEIDDYALLKGSGDDDEKAGAENVKRERQVVRPEVKESEVAENAQPEAKESEVAENAQPEAKESEAAENAQPEEKESEAAEETQPDAKEIEVVDNTQTERTESLEAENSHLKDTDSDDFDSAGSADNEDEIARFDSEPLAKTDVVLDNTTDTKEADDYKTFANNMKPGTFKEIVFDDEDKAEKKAPARFVPEGMVVPMDTEEDDETPRSGRRDILERRRNMIKMQSSSVKLKVGRKVIVNKEFDLDAVDGDDFDLF